VLATGEKAPLFVAAGTAGDIDLGALLERGPVVLYFFPRAMTGGCTTEAVEFNQSQDEFAALGITTVGISVDPVARLQRFREKYVLKLNFASDNDRSIGAAFGTLKGDLTTTHERDTVLLSRDGIVRGAYARVAAKGHAAAVLADARRLRDEGAL
jgi:peroxiredoxin Q/BCP